MNEKKSAGQINSTPCIVPILVAEKRRFPGAKGGGTGRGTYRGETRGTSKCMVNTSAFLCIFSGMHTGGVGQESLVNGVHTTKSKPRWGRSCNCTTVQPNTKKKRYRPSRPGRVSAGSRSDHNKREADTTGPVLWLGSMEGEIPGRSMLGSIAFASCCI